MSMLIATRCVCLACVMSLSQPSGAGGARGEGRVRTRIVLHQIPLFLLHLDGDEYKSVGKMISIKGSVSCDASRVDVLVMVVLCAILYPNPPGPGGARKIPTGEGPLIAATSQEEKSACAD